MCIRDRWMPVPCTVNSIGTKAHHSEDSTTYSIEVNYTYTYNNRRYTGTHHDLFDATMPGAIANQITNRLRPRAKTTCYVNPALPAQSVLDRSAQITTANTFIPILFTII